MATRDTYRILMVEDTIELARLHQVVLKRAGFVTYHAKDGEEAVRMIDEQQPDLVLLDLQLPGMGGWQVLDYMKSRYGGIIPVVVTTAYGDVPDRVIGKLQEVYRYLVKPIPPGELVRAVENALGLNGEV